MKKIIGLKKFWYKGGQIKEIAYTLNGKRNGECVKFSEDGTMTASCAYKNGQICGTLKEFYEDSSKELGYKNGKRHGPQFEYENGKIEKKYNCKNGNLHGEYIIYNDKERPKLVCNLVDGLLDGQLTSFDEKGKIKTLYNYKNDKKHGQCVKYQDNVCVIGHFCKGNPIKKWKEVDGRGKVIREFINSKLLGKAIFDNNKWNISL